MPSTPNRRQALIACALLAGPALANDATGLEAGDLAVAESLREKALAGSTAWSVVESLTTEVGPRLAGTPADARAVEWAKAKMQAMGFDKVYLEPVTFPVWLRHHERAEVLAPYPQPLVVTALGGSVGTGDTPVEAEVVAFASLDALKAAPEGSLEGKIAVIKPDKGLPGLHDIAFAGHGLGDEPVKAGGDDALGSAFDRGAGRDHRHLTTQKQGQQRQHEAQHNQQLSPHGRTIARRIRRRTLRHGVPHALLNAGEHARFGHRADHTHHQQGRGADQHRQCQRAHARVA